MLRDSVAVVVVRTRPRAIPLVMITVRKSTHGVPFVSHMVMGLRLAALWAAGALLLEPAERKSLNDRFPYPSIHFKLSEIPYS